MYLLAGIVALAIVGYILYQRGWFQSYTALSMDAMNDKYYESPVENVYHGVSEGQLADPSGELQPLSNGVDFYQYDISRVRDPGQYDTEGYAQQTVLTNVNSSKFRSNLTDNGDMISRRSIDASKYASNNGQMLMTHADAPFDPTPPTVSY